MVSSPVLWSTFHAAHRLGVDVALRELAQRSVGQGGLPNLDAGGGLAVGVQEMAARAQHAAHFVDAEGGPVEFADSN